MARSIQQIYDAMIVEAGTSAKLKSHFTQNGTLEDFEDFKTRITSSSKVGVSRMIFYIVATGIYTLEVIQDAFKKKIEDIVFHAPPQTDRWMVQETLKYQDGVQLTWNNSLGKYGYATVDSTKQIVKHAAVVTGGSTVYVKAAKGEVGSLEKLSDNEKSRLQAYWDLLQAPGTEIQIISQEPDNLKVELDVVIDPLILDELGKTVDGTEPVMEAIKSYAQGLPFNSLFWIDDFIDEIQKKPGVISPNVKSIQVSIGNGPYQSVDKYYLAYAGYLKLDSNSKINYIYV